VTYSGIDIGIDTTGCSVGRGAGAGCTPSNGLAYGSLMALIRWCYVQASSLHVETNALATSRDHTSTFLTRFHRGGMDRLARQHSSRRCQRGHARPPGNSPVEDGRRAWSDLRRNGGTPRPILQHKAGHLRRCLVESE
jgi:hypothetical protein